MADCELTTSCGLVKFPSASASATWWCTACHDVLLDWIRVQMEEIRTV
jgi:hypothetical protein